jgi:predicted metal-dependent phosphoesterase TrpH
MRYLTGTEISVTFIGQTVHIVGLGFDPDDQALAQGLRQTRGGRGARHRKCPMDWPKSASKAPTRAR